MCHILVIYETLLLFLKVSEQSSMSSIYAFLKNEEKHVKGGKGTKSTIFVFQAV